MSFINISNLNFSYGEKKILNDVSFSIPENDIVAIVGPSGSGKTTFLRLLAGFEKPDSGDYRLNGKSMLGTSSFERNTGFVFQDLALFPHLSVQENINYGLKKDFKKLNYWLDLFDLGELKDRYPHQISGGQKQRVALARSLAAKPKLMLFDEAFSALDKHLRLRLLDEVKNLIKKFEITTIMVTHDQEEAFLIGDKLAVFHQGHLVQIDRPEVVYSRPINIFTAEFLGDLNSLEISNIDQNTSQCFFGKVPISCQDKKKIYFRPEHCHIKPDGFLSGEITHSFFSGIQYMYEINQSLIISSSQKYKIGSQIKFDLLTEKIIEF